MLPTAWNSDLFAPGPLPAPQFPHLDLDSSKKGLDALKRLSHAMRVPIRELYELSGYVERGELDPVETPVPDDYEIRSFFTDNAWDDFTADEKEIVRLGMRTALKSKLNRE